MRFSLKQHKNQGSWLQIDKVIQFWKKFVSWVISIRGDEIALQTRFTRLKYSSAESAAEFGHGVLAFNYTEPPTIGCRGTIGVLPHKPIPYKKSIRTRL